MDKELKFSKLSEVELAEEVSENACILVEEDGKIKRTKGGLGGGGNGYPVVTLTTPITFGGSMDEESMTPLSAEDSELLFKHRCPITLVMNIVEDDEVLGALHAPCAYMEGDIDGETFGVFSIAGGLFVGFACPPGTVMEENAVIMLIAAL